MKHDYLSWLYAAAYSIHVLEEFTLDWLNWARDPFGFHPEWSNFYVVNATVIVLGICCAQVGWRLPEMSLMYPALMIINALFFHVLATLVKGRLSPGCSEIIPPFDQTHPSRENKILEGDFPRHRKTDKP